MLNVDFPGRSLRRILFLGAHCDDIEIGCGGTILKLLRERKDLTARWVVFSSDDRRKDEAQRSAHAFLKNAKKRHVEIKSFRNGFFPYCGAEIKEYFEEMKSGFSPDLIFTHCRGDLHQDHRVINELTWNTFRDHLVLEYEIVKYDGDLGSPNFFVNFDRRICTEKIRLLNRHFRSQKGKQWFTDSTFSSLMRIRGVESNSPGKYAEAFYCRKIGLL